MQEQLITFETAKLAKEKGFNEICKTAYGKSPDSFYYGNCTHKNSENIFLSAPSQSLLQKWLREVHNIYVSVPEGFQNEEIYFESWINIFKNKKFKEINVDKIMYSNVYEEALEVGLQEALKLIKIVKNK